MSTLVKSIVSVALSTTLMACVREPSQSAASQHLNGSVPVETQVQKPQKANLVQQQSKGENGQKHQLLTKSQRAKLKVKRKVEDREPEAATGTDVKKAVFGKSHMVAAANPYASEAGFNVLNQGGSAIDAAIAVQLVLTLVEPQSSGIGGGAFILHWDKQNKKLVTFNGRETAPSESTPELFLNEQGEPVRWIEAVVGGRSIGAPGVLKALHLAHQQYGKLPWEKLFEDAIRLADEGFIVSPRLAKLVAMRFNPGVTQLSPIKDYFFPNGEPIQAGQLLVNKPLANVYKNIATQGVDYFYKGELAQKMVTAARNSAIAPGLLSLEDLALYEAKVEEAVCGPYRSFKICGMAPPSSGGIAVAQILGQLAPYDLDSMAPNSLDAVHLFTQSSRLAFADRNRYIADPEFVQVPTHELLSTDYLSARAKLISQDNDMGKAKAGTVTSLLARADDNAIEMPSTSHISIVDGDGNAISMTTSVEMAFGSAVMVEGFILNNQLTDFSLRPEYKGELVANRLEPLKRPRSSMAPTMVFDESGDLKVVVGSPGGSRIINYVAQTLVGVLDWDLSIQEAINLGKVTNRNDVTSLEQNMPVADLKAGLEAKGHKVSVRSLNSGIHGIVINENGLEGGADPRREGKVFAK